LTNRDLHKMIQDVLANACRLFGFDVDIEINIRNMGRLGGTAERRGHHLLLNLNEQLTTVDRAEAYNTVSHEIAHLVCYRFPHLGKGHDAGWKRVHRALGGDGSRCHDMPLKKAKRTRQAVYQINGSTVNIGLTRHKRIQSRTRSSPEFLRDSHSAGNVHWKDCSLLRMGVDIRYLMG